MADETLDNQICEKCSAAVRPNALFCFNCGAQVAPDEVVIAETAAAKKVSDAWFRDDIVAAPESSSPIPEAPAKQAVRAKQKPETTSVDSKASATVSDAAGASEKTATKPAMKTAASLRQQSKVTQQRKAVEVTWEQPEGAPNLWFALITVILVAFAVGMLFLMLYIR